MSQDEVNQILRALERIEARNELADERHAHTDARVAKIERELDELDDSIRGNGGKGIRERLVKVENGMGILKWAAGILGAIFTAAISAALFG